jgi:acyl carrier protein
MGLDTVELVMAVEERFSIRIPNGVAAQLATVGQMHHYVVERLRQGGANPDSEAIYSVLADVISAQLGVKREVVRPEASFVDDLGAD